MGSKPFFVLFSIALTGCATVGPISTPPYYSPNPTAVLLKNEGDLQAAATASYGGETVTGAYAFSPHLGFLAQGTASVHKSSDPNGNQYEGEAGVGYYYAMPNTHYFSEVYGGLGWGSGINNVDIVDFYMFDVVPHQEITGSETRNFGTFWLQGATGYRNQNFSLMAIIQVSHVDVYHDVTNAQVRSNDGISFFAPHDTTYSSRTLSWTLTPALEARYGFDHIQLIGSIYGTIIAPLSGNGPANQGRNTPLLGSLGICYRF